MEYTNDMILNVNYGQAGEQKNKKGIFRNIIKKIKEHKTISTIISITIMLVALDFVLISSFINVLSSLG